MTLRSFPAAVAALIVAAPMAYAAGVDSAAISRIDPVRRIVTLTDGDSYTVSQDVALGDYHIGQNVTLSVADEGEGQTVIRIYNDD